MTQQRVRPNIPPEDLAPKKPTAVATAVTETGAGTPPAERANPAETGGPKGLDPTRYGDWERKGRCVDF